MTGDPPVAAAVSAAATPARGPRGGAATARNLGWLLGSNGLQAVLSLVYIGIATRTLGLTDFGRFVLITGAAQALITFVAFPTWQIVVQYGVAHRLTGDDAALGRLLRACAWLDGGAAVAGGAIVAIVLGLFGHRLGIEADLVPYVAGYAIIELVTLRSTPLGILRLRGHYAQAAWADGAQPVIRFFGALIAWWTLPSITGFLAFWALGEIAMSIAYWYFAAQTGDVGLLWRARAGWPAVTRDNPGFLRFAFSTSANAAIGLSEKQFPLLLVGAYVGPAAAGGFRLAFQLAQALSKLAEMLTRAAFPELVRAVRTTRAEQLCRMLRRILLASSAAAAVILLLVLAIGGHILAIVGGAAYESAYPILLWLAAAGCLDLATVGFEPVLMALHRAGSAVLIRLLAAAVMVVMTIGLAPRIGAIGAAIALLAGSLVAETLLAWLTFRAVAAMPPGAMLDRTEAEVA